MLTFLLTFLRRKGIDKSIEWIPVERGLPKLVFESDYGVDDDFDDGPWRDIYQHSKDCLITYRIDGRREIAVAEYGRYFRRHELTGEEIDQMNNACCWFDPERMGTDGEYYDVVAWMPCIKPYRKKRCDKKTEVIK